MSGGRKSAPPASAAPPTGAPRPPRRRALRVLLWIVGVAFGLRLLLWIALPLVLDHVAGGFGLRCDVDELSLALRSGRLELHGLVLREQTTSAGQRAPGGSFADDDFGSDDRVAVLEYALVDVDLGALLTGRVHVERVDLDGIALRAERPAHRAVAAAGAPGAADAAAVERAPSDAAPAGRAAPELQPIDLALPVSVDALRVQHARCLLRDDSVSPPLVAELALDVRLSDLGSAERPARLLVRAEARGVLDELRVEGTLAGGADRQQGALSFAVQGLRLAPLAGYLAAASLVPHATALQFHGALSGEAHVTGSRRETCEALLALSGLELTADGATAFALDRLQLAAPALGGGRTDLGELLLSGLHAAAERLPSGALRVAGLDLLPAAEPAAGAPSSVAPVAAGSAAAVGAPAAPAAAGSPWSLARLALHDLQLDVHDGAVSPAADLSLVLDELAFGPLHSDAPAGGPPASLAATLRAPGLFDTLSLAGTLAPLGPRVAADLRVQLAGLRPVRAAPYLAAAGLRSTLQDGALELELQAQAATDAQGALAASAKLTGLQLRDGARTLLALPAVSLDALTVSADGSSVHLGDIDIAGPALDVHRDASGSLDLLGLQTFGADAARPTAALAGPAPPSAAPGAPAGPATGGSGAVSAPASPGSPRVVLGRLRWHDVALHLLDEAVTPPVDLALRDVGLQVTDLAFGGDPARGDAQTGTLQLWLGAEGIVERLELQGTLASRPGPLDLVADLSLQARGVQGGQAAAWMSAAGLESRWRDGRLALALHAAIAQHDGALHADVALTGLQLENAGRRWLALQQLSLGGLALSDESLDLASVELAGLEASVERDADGALLFAGVRVPPASGDAVAQPAPAPAPAPAAATAAAPSRRVTVGRVALQDVLLHFADGAVSPAAEVAASLAAHVSGFDSAAPADGAPATFDVSLAVPGSLERLRLAGDALLTRDSQRLHVALGAEGLRPGGLAGYLPPGLASELLDGRLALQLDAQHGPAAAGGERVEVVLHDLALRDGAEGEPLCAVSRLALVAPRVDLAGGALDLDEVSLRGVQLAAQRGADGRVHALGFAFGAAPAADAPAGAAPAAGAVAAGAPVGGALVVAAPAGASRAESRGAAASGARRPWPVVRLRSLDIELQRLAWRDESRPDGAPVLASAHLFNPAPLVLLDAEPEALPPWDLTLQAACSPALDDLQLGLRVAPFVGQPSLELSLAGRGLHGAGLTALQPALAGRIDGSELTDGTFAAHLVAQLDWPRRSAVDFDLSHGFGAHLALDGVELRQQPQGELLAGLDGLDVSIARISPASGDVHVASIEVRTPHALLVNRADGLRVLGLRLIPPPADAAGVATAAMPATDPSATAAAEKAWAAVGTAPELRVDSASVTGLDLQFRDETLSPPLLLPIDSLDAELADFSTSPRSGRPMRFSLFLGAGEVPLPKPVKASSVLAGFAQAAVATLSGADESQVVLQPRRVFQELALTGRLTSGPAPTGWAQFNLTGLELMAFSSAARSADVIVGDGALDSSVKLRFRGADGVTIDSSTTLTDLSLSESANGPIAQYLKLPAPLDTVLFLLRDTEGRIHLDLNFGAGAHGVSGAELAQEAAATLGALIARAVANSPLRVTGMLTDALGVTGGNGPAAPEAPLLLDFGTGDATLLPEQLERLAPLVARLHDEPDLTLVLVQSLGPADVAHAAQLANPPAADSGQVVQRMRQQRRELLRQRDELASQARSYFAVGREAEAAELTARLADVDHDLGSLELGLDRVLELLAPGAERRADQRTRSSGLALGNLRLAAVAQALRQAGVEDPARAIEVRPARWQVADGEQGGTVSLTPRLRPRPKGLFAELFGWLWPF